MHFYVSLKNKHTNMIKKKFVFKTHASGGWGISTGDFVIDLCTKIRKPTPFIYLDFEKKLTHTETKKEFKHIHI